MTRSFRAPWRAALTLLACLAAGALPAPAAAADVEFHRADGVAYTIHDAAVYAKHKAEFDLFTKSIGTSSKLLAQWFGSRVPSPFKFHIRAGNCAIGIASGTVTIGDTCLVNRRTLADQAWTRQVSSFFMGYTLFQPVAGGWPYEVWSDPVNKVLQVDVTREIDGAEAASKIEADRDTDLKLRRYRLYRDLRNAHGWQLFLGMYDLAQADRMDWGKVGDDARRGEYIAAYLSLALRRKLGREAQAASVAPGGNTAVMEILRARNLLRNADRKGRNTVQAWEAFRAGRPAEVKSLLPQPQ